jgi:hypothetical protein
MFFATIDIKGKRYPITVYPVYYVEIDEVIYEAVHVETGLSVKWRTLHAALEQLAMLLVENE